ncbi:zinc finger, C2H2 type [Oesophagostomum dentatum]|uniref:Zinc finger, C2H2 type n=1 Tax=Oesophagostomum dentatum TaxID=61180 RepID=A0A0B1SUW8_OESDE|nr:zinc finger, C2H2 type [Oesophagostomum dentatum]
MNRKLEKKPVEFKCVRCGYEFASKRNLGKHMETCNGVRRKVVECPLCMTPCKDHKELLLHCKNEHDSCEGYEINSIEFREDREFFKWKEIVEEVSSASFIVVRTRYVTNGRTVYYHCNRAGIPHQKEGSCRITKKTTRHCTAFIQATFLNCGDNRVKADYCLEHINHDKNPALLRLSAKDRELVVSLLREGFTPRMVQDKIRSVCKNTSRGENQRLFFLTEWDIRYIAERFIDGYTKVLDISCTPALLEDDSEACDQHFDRQNVVQPVEEEVKDLIQQFPKITAELIADVLRLAAHPDAEVLDTLKQILDELKGCASKARSAVQQHPSKRTMKEANARERVIVEKYSTNGNMCEMYVVSVHRKQHERITRINEGLFLTVFTLYIAQFLISFHGAVGSSSVMPKSTRCKANFLVAILDQI